MLGELSRFRFKPSGRVNITTTPGSQQGTLVATEVHSSDLPSREDPCAGGQLAESLQLLSRGPASVSKQRPPLCRQRQPRTKHSGAERALHSWLAQTPQWAISASGLAQTSAQLHHSLPNCPSFPLSLQRDHTRIPGRRVPMPTSALFPFTVHISISKNLVLLTSSKHLACASQRTQLARCPEYMFNK